jgi:hypothetical protein
MNSDNSLENSLIEPISKSRYIYCDSKVIYTIIIIIVSIIIIAIHFGYNQ